VSAVRLLIMAGLMLLFFSVRNLLLTWHHDEQSPSELPPAADSADRSEIEPISPLTFDSKPLVDVDALDEEEKVTRLLAFAAKWEGSPYRATGCDPQGFDCSGFVQYCFREALGMDLPRSSRAMASLGKAIDLEDAKPGDLLFFTGSNATSERIGHVAILVTRDEQRVMMIHTSSSRGVITEDMNALTYYRERFRQARRPDYD